MKKLRDHLQETVLVATAVPRLDTAGGHGEVHLRQWFKTRGKVALAARNHLGCFWKALEAHEMVVMVLPSLKAEPGTSVKCFDA